jgi:hypothetical protein
MRRFWLGVLCVTAAFTVIAAAGSSYAMSFQSMPTRSDGTQFADPDEQFDNLTQPSQVGPMHLFGGHSPGDQFRNSWSLDPWFFGNDRRPRGYVIAPSKSHQ